MQYNRQFIFLILLTICSCKGKPVQNEIIYRDYSESQLRTYLNGLWIRGDKKEEEAGRVILHSFNFRSNTFGVFEHLEETNGGNKYVLATCPPTFNISKQNLDFYIQFHPMFGNNNYNFKIKSISNRNLVLTKDNIIEIYNKRD
jgi:hypothetical protein